MLLRRCATLLAAGSLLLVPTVGTASAHTSAVSDQDKTFLVQNVQTDLAEISLGRYMKQHAKTEAVKEFAADVVTDHRKALQKARALADRFDVDLPTTPNADQLAAAEEVKSHTGRQLDRAYVLNEIKAHRLSIKQTKTEIADGESGRVVAFARTYLPVAREHLDMARGLR